MVKFREVVQSALSTVIVKRYLPSGALIKETNMPQNNAGGCPEVQVSVSEI